MRDSYLKIGLAKKGRKRYTLGVDEGRKRVLLIAILAARKLGQQDRVGRTHATIGAISDAIRWAEQLMTEIDRRWPVREHGAYK